MNISKVAQESGKLTFEVNGVTKSISLLNEAGDTLSTFEILEKISQDWQDMTLMERQAIGAALAGKNQYEVFASVLSNFDHAIESSEKALEAEGSALKENQAYLDSLEGHVQKLRSAYMNLVVGDGGLTQVIKTIIDLGTTILNFLNTPLGGVITKVGAVLAGIALVNTALNALVGVINTSLIGGITGLIGRLTAWAEIEFGLGTTIAEATALTYAQSGAVGVLGAALGALGINPVVLAIMGVIGALYALKKAHDVVVHGIEEGTEKLQNSTDAFKEAENKLKEIETDLENLKNKKLEVTDQKDLDNLEKEENYLNNQLILQKAIADEKERQLKEDARALSTKTGTSVVSDATWQGGGNNFATMGGGTGTSNYIGTASDAIQRQTEDIQHLKEKYDEASISAENYKNTALQLGATEQQLSMTKNQLKEIFGNLNDETAQAILNYQEEINKTQELSDSITQIAASGADNADSIQLQIDAGIDLDGSLQKLIDDFIDVVGTTQDATDASEEATDELKEQEEAISDLAEKYNVAVGDVENLIDSLESQGVTDFSEQLSQAEEQLKQTAQTTETLADQYKEVLSDIDELSEVYKTLSNAVAEYNANGEFSIDTATALLQLEPQYLALLQEENGQLSLNKAGYDTLVDAKIAEAKATVYAQAQDQAHEIVLADLARQAQGTASTVQQQANGVQNAANTISSAGNTALNGAMKFSQAWNLITNNGGIYSGLTGVGISEMVELQRQTRSQIKTLESLGTSIKKVGTAATTAGNKASGAANKSKRAAKSAENAAKKSADLIREYVIYKMEQWIDKLEAKVDKLEKKLDKLQTKLEKVQEKYEALIERNQGWLDTLVDNFEIVERFVSTGNMELDALLKKLAKLNKEYEDQQKAINDAIDARKELIDGIDEEIDKIEEQEKAIKETYSAQLEALEQTNDELERQIKLQELLDALNKAKSKMVKTYVEGQGFVYTQDSAAVSQAEKNLQEYQRSERQRKEKETIEAQRDAELEVLEKQKSELEKQKQELENANKDDEKLLSQLEKQYEEEKKQLDQQAQSLYEKIYDQTDALKEKLDEKTEKINNKIKRVQDKIDIENAKLERANKELTDYKNQTKNDFSNLTAQQKKQGDTIINRLQEISDKMGEKEKQKQEDRDNSEITKDQLTSIGISSGSADVFLNLTLPAIEAKMKEEESKNKNPTNTASKWNSQAEVKTKNTSKSTTTSKNSKKKKAIGDRYIDENGMYLLGDNPNQNELVIGSRLNGAVGVNLNQGSGVVPHTLTSALMDMAEEYQRGNSNGVLNGTTNNNKSTSISIGNISLPSVQDGNAFVDYLQNFSLDMTQAAYSRT